MQANTIKVQEHDVSIKNELKLVSNLVKQGVRKTAKGGWKVNI